jgi:hypothetical protein
MTPVLQRYLALGKVLDTSVDTPGQMGVASDQVERVLATSDELVRALRTSPDLQWPLEAAIQAYLECGRGVQAWLVDATHLVGRGATMSLYLQTLSRFHGYLVPRQGKGIADAVLSSESVDEATSRYAPDDAVGPLARGIRRALAAGTDRAQLARADAELREARRLAPGVAAVLAWRGALAVFARRPAEARAFFEELDELGKWSGSDPNRRAFEAAIYARAGDLEATRASLAAIRDARDLSLSDAWQFDGEPLSLLAEKDAECKTLLGAIRARLAGPREGLRPSDSPRGR